MMQKAGHQRKNGVGRVLTEVVALGLAVVTQLAVDPVPPDEVVDAERDDRQQRRRPRAADLDLVLRAADVHLVGHGTSVVWGGRALTTLAHLTVAFQYLCRDPLAGLQGALHVAAPYGGGLGARPVDATDRLSQCRTAGAPASGAEVRGRSAARPLLRRPLLFGVVERPFGARDRRGARSRSARRRGARPPPSPSISPTSGPPTKPSRTPAEPSRGELSKVSVTGPASVTASPLKPSSRQNGFS